MGPNSILASGPARSPSRLGAIGKKNRATLNVWRVARVSICNRPEFDTRKVKLELEVDTSTKDLGPNPYAKIIHLAKAFDQWRIFPRIFISTYIYLLYEVVIWYMELPGPTMEQSGLVSVVVGAGAAWFGLYTGSSKK